MKIIQNKEKNKDIVISEICEVKSSKRVMAEHYLDAPDPVNGVRFYRGGDILDKEKSKWISKDKFLDLKNNYGAPIIDDILVSAIGTVGLIKQVDEEDFYFKDGNIIWLKNFKENTLKTYVKHALKTRLVQSRMQKRVNRGVYNALSIEAFKEIKIPLPNIKEQEKIANFLSERESYLQSIQSLIAKMEQRNQYFFNKMFLGEYDIKNDKVVFGDISKKQNIKMNKKNIEISSRFSKKKIPEIISLKKGGSIKKDEFNYDGNGTQYLRTSDVWEESSSKKDIVYYNGSQSGLIYKAEKDWIVCFDGFNKKPKKGTLGLVTNKGEGYCSGELHLISGIDQISYRSVNIALLRSSYFQNIICRYGEGTTVKHAGKHVRSIELPYIPYEEQFYLDSFISGMLDEVDLLKKLYSKEKQVFQWLCEKLVSGEYRIED